MSEDPIERMIQEISDGEVASPERKEIEKVRKDLELDIDDINSIAEHLVKLTAEDRSKADKIFEMFYTDIGIGKDRTEASKEALTRALELKIEASKNIIELLKIKTKANEMKTNIGLAFNVSTGKRAGIDLSAIKNARKKTN
jgi:hypothetical protein